MRNLSAEERDAIAHNFPIWSDIVKVAQEMQTSGHYPMAHQMHVFIEQLCGLCSWPIDVTFQVIFKEKGLNEEKKS